MGKLSLLSSAQSSNTSCPQQENQKLVFLNAKEGKVLRTTLDELGHPQPPTPLETDNTTETGNINGRIKPKRTRAMDMHFYWVKDRVTQGQFHVYWGPGYKHLADYFTKHRSPAHHKRMREIYIHTSETTDELEGNLRFRIVRVC
jgi:hypothetical protein